MPLSLYEISIPPFLKHINSLKKMILKGQAAAGADETRITGARLIPDMCDFCYQIQRVSDTSKGCAVRVGKATPVAMDDNEKTIPELIARLDATIAVLESVSPDSMDGMEEQEVVMKLNGSERKFTGLSYVVGFVIPNFYFHSNMAYALLRKEGVAVGKADYMGLV